MSNNIPKLGAPDFICPNCKIHCTHEWNVLRYFSEEYKFGEDDYAEKHEYAPTIAKNDKFWIESHGQKIVIDGYVKGVGIRFSSCLRCKHLMMWFGNVIVYPEIPVYPLPNQDLDSDEVMSKLYHEAGVIATKSPRASAALLRICLDKLCKKCGGREKTIYEDINQLIKEERLDDVSKNAAHLLRIVGNKALHDPDQPALIKDADDSDTVRGLFGLINLIADQLLTQPREREERLNRFKGSVEMQKAANSVEQAKTSEQNQST